VSTQVDTSIQGKEHATVDGSKKQSTDQQKLEQLCINTIRTLAMDAVQKANSGHPGAPMALAPLAFVLWDRYLRFNPRNPHWPGRDRFILSNGHASMLLYAMLHLTGFDLSLDEIKQFRQWGSKAPGHPEYRLTAGVETTTGPLGQGCGNSVGFAMAQRWLAAQFSKSGHNPFDYRTYVFCSDGDLMEGVSNEAASIAGHLGLSNLIWFYDNNHISLEGTTSLSFSDDIATRFRGWHWNVLNVSDVNDLDLVDVAIKAAQREVARPTLVIVDTHIGWGSPNRQDTKEAHGEALGEEEVRLTKQAYGWPPDAQFLVPNEVKEYMGKAIDRGKKWESEWNERYQAWSSASPDLAKMWQQMSDYALPDGWDKDIPTFPADAKGIATRESNAKVLNAVANNVPWLIGGSADLNPSTKTQNKESADFERNSYGGRNFHFGVREHAMGAIANGMSLSGVRPYTATFFIFSDYMKPPIRLAAIMDIPVIFIYTHDSIGLGEDGTTHQPIEQLLSLRGVPRLMTFRPADANEVAEMWRVVMPYKKQPVVIVLTRQGVPTFDRSKYASAAGLAKGAYVMADSGGTPEVILMGTGSEVQLCVGAYEKLTSEGVKARVVSMPCWELFEQQSPEYRKQVFPPEVKARVAVEAGTTLGWRQYVGAEGVVVGHDDFGVSAPIKDLLKHFGFTVDNVIAKAREVMKNAK
jgi:transketolase